MSRVLVVGGDQVLWDLISQILEGVGHEVESQGSSLLAVQCLANADPQFDLLLVNSIYLQPLDLDKFLRCVRPLVEGRTQVILSTGGVREDVLAMLGDVRDEVFAVLPKPFEVRDLLGLVKRALLAGRMAAADRNPEGPGVPPDATRSTLPEAFPPPLAEPARVRTAVALSLLDILDRRARGLGAHGIRVHDHAYRLGAAIGLDEPSLSSVRYGSLLHDLGKCVLPARLLSTWPPESDEDRNRVREHGVEGAGLLRGIPLFEDCVEVIHLHHERFDGAGHPQGLRGDDIPIGARICAVANAFDNVCEGRRSRLPRGLRRGYRALQEEAGGSLDPGLVMAFGRTLDAAAGV